jgi:hypothetical protein
LADTGATKPVALDPLIGAVEIKITANAKDEDAVRAALGSEGVGSRAEGDLLLRHAGARPVRSGGRAPGRLVRDGADDSTVKLRPVAPDRLSDRWKETEGFGVELDAVGDDAICSANTVEQDRGEIADTAAGRRPIRKLFSDDQESLLAEFGPADVGWDDLSVLGPEDARKWKVEPAGLPYELRIEEWVSPTGPTWSSCR